MKEISMRISRYGNNSSELLNKLIEDTQKEKEIDTNAEPLVKMASKILKQEKPKSLREVLSQFEGLGNDFDSGEEVLPDEGLPGSDIPEGTSDNEEVKQKLVDALIAACGSFEEAKTCLETMGSSGLTDELGGEPLGEEIPGEAEMGAPGATEEMPQPMEMPAPMPY